MSELAYDIQLTAPGPNPVKGGQAYPTGATGTRDFFYWVVAHFPIGVSVSEPIPILNAPGVLSGIDAVLIQWEGEAGALSYDVLRTNTPIFPPTAGNYVLTGGIAAPGSSAIDQGQALTAFNPTGLPFGAPVTRHIYLNNRDYSEPTIELPALKVSQITFPDGSSINTVAAAVGQSPWVGDIDAAGHRLDNASTLACTVVQCSGGGSTMALSPLRLLLSTTGPRWYLGNDSAAEGGGNTGTNYQLSASDDTGAYLYAALIATRSGRSVWLCADGGGNVAIGHTSPAYKLDVAGSINITGAGAYLINGAPISTSGSQTPWLSPINGANFMLHSVGRLAVGNAGAVDPYNDANVIHLLVGSASSLDYGAVTVGTNRPTTNSTIGGFTFANYATAALDKRIAMIAAETNSTPDSGDMAFFTGKNGVLSEWLRITEIGMVKMAYPAGSVNNPPLMITTPINPPPTTYDAHMLFGQVYLWLDEPGNKLMARVKYSTGVFRTGAIPLV